MPKHGSALLPHYYQETEWNFVIPAKTNTWRTILKEMSEDALVQMRISPQARLKCKELPEFWQARAITVIDRNVRKQVLLTSLLDRKRYKPADIAACYGRR